MKIGMQNSSVHASTYIACVCVFEGNITLTILDYHAHIPRDPALQCN